MLDGSSSIFRCAKNGTARMYEPPFTDVGTWLASQARRFGDKPAIIFHHIDRSTRDTLSYTRLHELVACTATVLARDAGLGKGDSVAYALPNRPEALVLNLAALWLGARSVPLDLKRDPLDRKRFKLRNADCKVLIVPGQSAGDDAESQWCEELDSLLGDQITFSLGPHSGARAALSAKWAACGKAKAIRASRDHNAPCAVLYTSGTTGHPKGALLTPRSICANALGIIDWLGFDEHDRVNLILPLHHINSTVFAMAALLAGGTIVLNSRYSVSRFWEIIARERATTCSIVPTIMLDLLTRQAAFADDHCDISALQRIVIGSAPVPAEVAMRFVETFDVPLTQGYGSTETSLRVAGVPIDLSPSVYETVLAENAVGVELAYCNVRVAGTTEPDTEGELLVRGPVLARGYLNDPEATQASFANGWFHTGDLGTWREIAGRRFFFVKGRLREIIIKGGVNISPIAVENAVLSTFSELTGCYVVGVPDDRFQEEIAAAVVLPESPEEGANQCLVGRILARARAGTLGGLSAYESPRYVVPVQPGELPTTSTGKVQRTVLRDVVARRIKQTVQPDPTRGTS